MRRSRIDPTRIPGQHCGMHILANSYRGTGMPAPELEPMPFPSVETGKPQALVDRCPRKDTTPLVQSSKLATLAHVARVDVKDERGRMGLGSFKALGAAYVIAVEAEQGLARGRTYVAASAGNHGLSVAAGASAFGARSVVYLAETVPEAFAERLRAEGAEVVRHGAIYEDSLTAAKQAAKDNGWVLLSDTSWDGYTRMPRILMEGYLVLMAEAIDQVTRPPTHMFLQAGVGGLAVSCAALARQAWGDALKIVVVEPEFAPALQASIEAGRPVVAPGPVSSMGRLDCKEPSLIALKGLARDADFFVTISEDEAAEGTATCRELGLQTTTSGGAGVAALLSSGSDRAALDLTASSRVLAFLSEGPEQ